MNIEAMLSQLKEILPPDNFKPQPDSATKEIQKFEVEFQMNTADLLTSNHKEIPEEIKKEWLKNLEIFEIFGGVLENINHLPKRTPLKNNDYISQESESSEQAIEYVNEKSKELEFTPYFSFLKNMHNLHSILWMKQ